MDLDISFNEDPIMESVEDYIADEYLQSVIEMSLEDILDEYIATIETF